MKVLVVTNHSYMLWQFRRELITALLEEHEVVVATPFVGHVDDLETMGCKCIETKMDRRSVNPFKDFKLLLNYWEILKEETPDLVLTYSIKPNVYAGFACRLQNIRYCANVQGLGTAFQNVPMASIATIMYKLGLKKAQTVFFENASNAEVFRRRNIVEAKRQRVLPGAGVNLRYYPLKPYPKREQIRFLYMGRIMKEKGVEELMAAMRRLHHEFGDKVALDFVGFFEEQYKDDVERLCQDGIAAFHGFQEDPRPYYEAADCVVLPSYHEGMSNVLLEAAATGRAIITSDIPGCREAIKNEETGYLCQPQDEDSLYECLANFASLTLEEREGMGKAGRYRVTERFEKEMVVLATMQAISMKPFVELEPAVTV